MFKTPGRSLFFAAAVMWMMLSASLSAQAATTLTEEGWTKTDGLYAVISTAKGEIVLWLDYTIVPMTVGNFVSLCEGRNPMTRVNSDKPFYDGLSFHRVVKNFMIQGGRAASNGGDPGYTFPDEFLPDMKHNGPGRLSMANAGPNTNNTQFFITHVATPWLDGRHTVFGHVAKGMDVVNAITENDIIQSIRIVRIGAAANAFDAVKSFTDGYKARSASGGIK